MVSVARGTILCGPREAVGSSSTCLKPEVAQGTSSLHHCSKHQLSHCDMMIALTTIFALTSSSSMVVVGAFVIYPTFTSLLCCSFDNIQRECTIVPKLNRRQRLPLTPLQKKMMMATTNTNSLNENEEHENNDNNNDNNNMNSSDDNNRRRKVHIQKEMEICNMLKVKELKVQNQYMEYPHRALLKRVNSYVLWLNYK